MSQSGNMELVENLKPFIAKMTRQQIIQTIEYNTTSDADAERGVLLVGDFFGRVRFDGIGLNTDATDSGLDIDGNIRFVGTQQIANSGGGLYLTPIDGVFLEPDDGQISLVGDVTVSNALAVGSNITVDGDIKFTGSQQITTFPSGVLTLAPVDGLVVTGNAAFGSATNTTNAAIKAIASTDSDYALYLKQRTNQDAYIFKIEAADTTDALLIITKEGDLESGNPGFVTNTSGWQITHDGRAEFWSAKIRGELHATVFSADEVSAANGQLMIITSGVVDSPTNLPSAIDLTYTINIKASIATGFCPFIVNDILLVQFASKGGTGLDVWEVYSEVDTVGAIVDRDLANDEPGYYPLTCTWRVGGEAGLEIPAPLAIAKWGTVGGTGLEGGIVMAADDPVNSPYIQVFTLPSAHTWGSGAPIKTPHVHMGNLDGVMALGNEWGIALAQDLASTADENPSVVVGSGGVKLRNVDQMVYDSSGNPRVLIASDGNVKFGTDIGGAATTMFHFDPAAGSLALRNTTLESYNASLQTFELTPAGELLLGTDVSANATTTFHVYESGSVTIGRYESPYPYIYWNNSGLGTLKLQNASIEMWASEDSKRHAYLDYNGYFYLGEDTSTHASISFAHYGETSGLASGDIRLGTLESGKANMFWDQSARTLSIRNYTTPMIVFEGSTGDSYFAGRMDIGSATYPDGKIVATNTILNKDGIEINVADAGGHSANRGYTFVSGSTLVSGLYSRLWSGYAYSEWIAQGLASYNSYMSISSQAASGKTATVALNASVALGSAVSLSLFAGTDVIEIKAANLTADGNMRVFGGFRVGSSVSVSTGYLSTQYGIVAGSYIKATTYLQGKYLLIDQLTDDGVAIRVTSTDVTGMGTQGMSTDNTYFQVQKLSETTGGAFIKGAGNSTRGLQLIGSCVTPSSTYAALMLQGQKNNSAVGATEKVLQIWNHATEVVRVLGDGDFLIKDTYGYFDEENDMALISIIADTFGGGILENEWDDFVTYNRDDLNRLNIITKDGFTNQQNMMKLFVGTFRQEHAARQEMAAEFEQRISQLETQLSRMH